MDARFEDGARDDGGDPETRQARRAFGRRALARAAGALAGLAALAAAARSDPEPAAAGKKKPKKKTCTGGKIACGGKCVDPAADNRNCGKCGTVCKDDLRCRSGKCACPTAGTSKCGTRCFNLATSQNNCGACGNACTGELTCLSGVCGCAAAGTSKCGDRCYNLQANNNHCGACGNACTGELTCLSGVCGCAAAGTSKCGDRCYNLQANNNHCGACGNACTGELTCVSGSCGCTGGKSVCGTKCYDLQTDQAHCGNCNTVCDPDVSDTCSGGTCNCGANPACTGAGVYCVGETCVDLNVCPTCTFTTVQPAIDAAPEGATIPIAAGTYEGLVTINKNLTLAGAGNATTTLTWTDAAYLAGGVDPIVTVSAGKTVTIEDLKITGGNNTGLYTYGYGGGIWNEGSLTVNGCSIASNQAKTYGGGIYSHSTASLTLIDTDVESNTCTGLGGGGICTLGPLSITNGEISGNAASGGSGLGGGITCMGTLTATGTTIKNNSAVLFGGGCRLTGAGKTWTFTNCDIDSNSAKSAGGVSCEVGTLTLDGTTTIRRNTTTQSAGGLYLERGSQAALNDTSSIKDNVVTTSSGAGGGVIVGRGETGSGYGYSSLTLNGSSTISGNTLTCSDVQNSGGGGVYVDGANDTTQVGRMTMNGTSSVRNNSALNSAGGGIRSLGKIVLSANCLVSGNTASSGGGISSGGPYAPNDQLTGVTSTNVTGNTPDNAVTV